MTRVDKIYNFTKIWFNYMRMFIAFMKRNVLVNKTGAFQLILIPVYKFIALMGHSI